MGRAEFRVEEDAGPGPDGLGTVPGNYYIVHTHTLLAWLACGAACLFTNGHPD